MNAPAQAEPTHIAVPRRGGESTGLNRKGTVATIHIDAESEPETLTFPAGCTRVFVQFRMCGDYYAEIEGKRRVAAVHADPVQAIRAAITKVAA